MKSSSFKFAERSNRWLSSLQWRRDHTVGARFLSSGNFRGGSDIVVRHHQLHPPPAAAFSLMTICRLFNRERDDGPLDYCIDSVLEERLLPADLLQGEFAASFIEFFVYTLVFRCFSIVLAPGP